MKKNNYFMFHVKHLRGKADRQPVAELPACFDVGCERERYGLYDKELSLIYPDLRIVMR